MKELTIEEKAQRYDEAIKIAREINDEQRAQPFNVMTRVFPEIKEGDDERIRKEIITYLSTVEDKELIPYEPWIAWLKKQGEHANFRNKIQIGDKVTRNEDGVLVNLSQLKRVAKPADKVKPKFKVGDWVVRGKTIAQILDIQEQYYIGLDIDGTDFTSSKFLSDDKIHLWAIDDAKAGDVLVTDSGRPFIFKGCLDKIHPNNPVAYCGIDSSDDFYECSGINWWTDENVYPATQEQRDLLFQKMKEAGYEWDADKKELKKIEQKPWSDEDEKMFEHIIAKATLHFSSINYLDEEEINFLKSLKDRVQPQPKQEWSQDDEQYLLVCKNALAKYQTTDKWDATIISQWLENKLKFLKDRVQPQLKQEWSKEDEKIVEHLINLYKVNLKVNHYPDLEVNKKVNELKMFFKSLRPQSTWKPSDEQIEILEHFVRSIGESGYASPYDNNTKLLYSLLSDLKKLKG